MQLSLGGQNALAITSALVLALGASACNEVTGSHKAVDVAVRVVSVSAPTFATVDSQPQLTCDVQLEATATGSGTAAWAGATFRIFSGPNRNAPLDSTTLASTQLHGVWSATDGINAGQTEHATLTFGAGLPFGITASFGYVDENDGRTKAAEIPLVLCGPSVPTSGVAAPTISNFALTPASGAVELGTPVSITYTASSPLALWETTIVASGAFDTTIVLGEQLIPSQTRTVPLMIPLNVKLGIPLALSISVVDATGRRVSQVLNSTLSFVDHTPPTVMVVTPFVRGGYFAPGDNIALGITAADNRGLAEVVYTLGTPFNVKDSIAVKGLRVDTIVSIPVRSEWVGQATTLSVIAHDLSGLSSTTLTPADSVRIYPANAHPVKAALVGLPTDVAIDTKRRLIYASVSGSQAVDVLPFDTMSPESMQMPAYPQGLDISTGGDSLIMAMGTYGVRELAIVDLRNRTLPPTLIPLTALDSLSLLMQPQRLRIAANDKVFIMVTEAFFENSRILEVDLRTGQQRFRTDAPTGGINNFNEMIERSRDRSHVVITDWSNRCIRVYDVSTDAFAPCAPATFGRELSVDSTGHHLTEGATAYTTDGWIAKPLRGIAPEAAMEIAPDGQSVVFEQKIPFTLDQFSLERQRISDDAMLERIPLGSAGFFYFFRFSDDGSVIVGFDDVRITLVDLRH